MHVLANYFEKARIVLLLGFKCNLQIIDAFPSNGNQIKEKEQKQVMY